MVVGHAREQVDRPPRRASTRPPAPPCRSEQNGTGHAVRMALEALAADGVTLDGTVVVTCGDTPLLTAATLARAGRRPRARRQRRHRADRRRCRTRPATAGSCGTADGAVAAIVEQKDADRGAARDHGDQLRGVRLRRASCWRRRSAKVTTDNAQGEEYLTDILAILRAAGHRVGARGGRGPPGDRRDQQPGAAGRGAPDAQRPAAASDAMLAGVDGGGPGVDVAGRDGGVRAGRGGAAEHPAARCDPDRGEGAEVGPNCTLTDTGGGRGRPGEQHRRRTARRSVRRPPVGPYAYLRPGTRLAREGEGGHVRGDEERDDRRGHEGAAPELCGRRDDRRGHQHRRGERLRQLRRRGTSTTRRSGSTAGRGRTTCSSRRSRSGTARTRRPVR